ncbi:hypothetical protein L596_025607 [Steinernema carpocapsae]|uniref:Lebercilin domain-containing protein n=1 Tax=Steinernema carpocapsae TaxID=34508 RepID=A0A4U5M8G6_STECR|nr:hypothetical protein L596_025607 [Steinernema carpocapsae]
MSREKARHEDTEKARKDEISRLKNVLEQYRAGLVELRAKRLETAHKYQKTTVLLKAEMERRTKLESVALKLKEELQHVKKRVRGLPALVQAVKDLVKHLDGSEASLIIQRRIKKVASLLKAIQAARDNLESTSDEDEALLEPPKRREALRPEIFTEERPIEELMDALTTLTSAEGLEPAR